MKIFVLPFMSMKMVYCGPKGSKACGSTIYASQVWCVHTHIRCLLVRDERYKVFLLMLVQHSTYN